MFLICSGANIECKDRDNFTPLLLAASYGHAKTVELLLQRGANPDVEDKNDKTAVFLAAEENKLEVLEVIIQLSMGVNIFCGNEKATTTTTKLRSKVYKNHRITIGFDFGGFYNAPTQYR